MKLKDAREIAADLEENVSEYKFSEIRAVYWCLMGSKGNDKKSDHALAKQIADNAEAYRKASRWA